MLQTLKIVSFKGISQKKYEFQNGLNLIIGNNGVGKTNILESIGLLFWNHFSGNALPDVITQWENMFYIDADFTLNGIPQTLSLSYEKEENKKVFLLNGKKATKKTLWENSLIISVFIPFTMNLFYLGPKYRRDFLDEIIKNSYPNYQKTLQNYENIIKNRNKLLKNISEQKSSPDEITFWDEELIKYAKIIYSHRVECLKFINEDLKKYTDIFWIKVDKIQMTYKTKTNLSDIEISMRDYLKTNFQRDTILAKTHIGPHLDDFDIVLNGLWVKTFASRGETKTILISLKLLELDFIEKISGKKSLFLIDDLMSELDDAHRDILLEKLKNHQVIITNITDIEGINAKRIFI
jgi:DNA replication and repair protein RecF